MLLVAVILLLQSMPAQTVDRLMAVVGGEPIFLSDVRDARALWLLDPDGALAEVSAVKGETSDEAVLERLIDRRLVLAEVARYLRTPPAPADVDAAVAAWTSRAGGPGARDAAMARAGASLDLARAFLADTLRINSYIDQRFTAAAQPTREEARAFYQANLALFVRDRSLAGFEDVEGEARAKLAEERRLALVREWLAGLRSRAQVRVVGR
jgi:hypothetical protein